jgi:hypothetical protein
MVTKKLPIGSFFVDSRVSIGRRLLIPLMEEYLFSLVYEWPESKEPL